MEKSEMPKYFLPLVICVFAVGLIFEYRELRRIRVELAEVKADASSQAGALADAVRSGSPPIRAEESVLSSDAARINERLASMENSVQELTLGMGILMERGILPLSQTKLAALRKKFLDPSLSDDVRLQALRALRQAGALDDDLIRAGVAWLGTLTEPGAIRSLLEQLVGTDNPILRDLFLRFATHADARIRQQAINGLGHFAGDVVVDALLWKLLATDEDADVRRQAEASIRQGPMTETRAADLQRRTLDSNASFRERLTAFKTLCTAKAADGKTTTAFLNDVTARNRPDELLALFRDLDNTGNLAAAPVLINALQTGGLELRGLALDALSEMQSDPTVAKWVDYAAEHDSDERVRAEAARVRAQR